MHVTTFIAQRMRSLRLHESARSASVLETVAWMGALQAQDYESGLWAIGARAEGLTRVDVEQAIARREIVRTWPMRGTWHFIPAVDAQWMQDLLAARLLPAMQKRSSDFGFDEDAVSRCRNLVIKTLQAEESLSRGELVQRIGRAGFPIEAQAGNHLLRRFGNEGLLCNGLMAGKEPAFVLRDEWVRHPVKLDRDTALAELAVRYFRSHGPATLHDFVWWTGLTVRDARTAIAAAGQAVTQRTLTDCEHWFTGDDDAPAPSAVELLPAFDEHLLGYQDRRAVLDDERAESVCPGGNGVFRPTLVVKGRVAGLWKRKEAAKKMTVEVTPYAPLSESIRRNIEQAAQRLGEFYGKPVAVAFA